MIPNIWLATLHRNARQTEPRFTQAASNWFDLFVPEASWLDSFSAWLDRNIQSSVLMLFMDMLKSDVKPRND